MSIRFEDHFTGTANSALTAHTSDSGHTWANAAWSSDNPAFISGLGTVRSNNGSGTSGTQQTSFTALQDDLIIAFKVAAISLAIGYTSVAWDIDPDPSMSQMYKFNLHPDGSFYCDKLLFGSGFSTLTPTQGTLNGGGDGVVSGMSAGDEFTGYITVEHLTGPTRMRMTLYDRAGTLIGEWIDTSSVLAATRLFGIYQQDGASTDSVGIHLDDYYLVDDPTDVYSLDPGAISEVSHGATTAVVQSDTAASGGTGSITYQWKHSVGAGVYSNISGATSAAAPSLVGLITPSAVNHVKRTAHTTVDGDVDSNVVTFIANTALAGGTIAVGTVTTSSVQGVSSAPAATGSGSGYIYQWQIDLGSGMVDISGATTVGPASKSGLTDDTDYPMRRRATDGESTVAYSNTITPHTDAVTGSIAATPTAVPSHHSGNMVISLVGTSTSWSGGTTFSISGVTGAVKISQVVTNGTHATITIQTGSGNGTLTISDGSISTTIAVNAPAVSVTPTSMAASVSQTITLAGTNCRWNSETASTLFSVSGGTGASISSIVVTGANAATATLNPGSATGTLTITDNSTAQTDTVTVTPAPTMTATPSIVPASHAGGMAIAVVGVGTTWTSATVFRVTGVSGASKVSQSVADGTHATVTIKTGAAVGTLTITDGSSSVTVSVVTPNVVASPAVAAIGSTVALRLVGTNTRWTHETALTLFRLTGGTGASIASTTVESDTVAVVQLTAGTKATALKITDTSTKKIAIVTVKAAAGSNEIIVPHATSGLDDLHAVMLTQSGHLLNVTDGSVEEFDDANWPDYVVPLTEIGEIAAYSGVFPSACAVDEEYVILLFTGDGTAPDTDVYVSTLTVKAK